MGNLQALLGDCNLGEVPAYMRQYMPEDGSIFSRSKRGDETFMVYAEGSSLPRSNGTGVSHVNDTTALLSTSTAKERKINERIMSDLVDLCVDGLDPSDNSVGSNRRTVSGSAVYQLPVESNSKEIRTQIWRELDGVEEEQKRNTASGAEQLNPEKGNVESITENASVELDTEGASEVAGAVAIDTPQAEPQAQEPDNPPLTVRKTSKRKGKKSKVAVIADEEANKSTPVDQALLRLKLCREEEMELRKAFSLVAFPFEIDEATETNKWYIVDANWFRQWSKFLDGQPRPGPITNSVLLSQDNKPKPGLNPGEHYFGLDQAAWNQLSGRYGADVAICKSTYDIYA